MSNAGGDGSSSSMISLQRSVRFVADVDAGPAISFLTWRMRTCKALESCSLESVGRAS